MLSRLRGSVTMALAGGAVSTICQSLLMRESLHARHLGELAAALSLAGWLLSSGAGAAASTLFRAGPGAWGVMLCLMPPVSLAGVAASRLAGASPAAAALPAGLLAGAVFVPPWRGKARPSVICSAEAVGALAGGALFVLASRHLLCATLSAAALCLAGAGVTVAGLRAGLLPSAAAAAVLASGLSGALDSDIAGRGVHGFSIVEVSASPRGEVAVMEREGQRAFFRGGILEAWDSAPEAAEQLALVPLALACPERVVYAGSSPDVAAMTEAWPGVSEVVVVSTEGSEWIEGGRTTEVRHGDARSFISSLDAGADLIIVSSQMPLTLSANRLLTREFLAECRRALSPGGILAFDLPLGENRMAPLQAGIAASIVAASPFRTNLVVPMGGALFLMGDSLPDAGSVGAAVVLPEEYEPVLLDGMSLSWRLSPDAVKRYMEPIGGMRVRPNADLDPVAFRMLMSGWSVYGGGAAAPAVLRALTAAGVLAILSAALLRRPAATAMTLAPGVAGTGLEVLCLLVVQSVLGTAWVMVGAVTACFMGGFAAGSASAGVRPERVTPPAVLLAAAFPPAAASGAMLMYSSGILGGGPLAAVCLACTALSGAAAGAGFAAAAGSAGTARTAGTAGLCEMGALAGSAASCVALPMLLLPALGAVLSGVVLFAFVLAALPAALDRRGSSRSVRD